VFGAAGGASTATVKAPAGCRWSATSGADWIRIDAGAAGSGDGTIAFTAAPYDGTASRTGSLVIAEQTFTMTQNGCTLRLQPTELTAGDQGGLLPLTIETDETCRWAAESPPAWMSIEPAAGVGPARATIRIDENPGGTRETVLRVNAQPVTIRQAAEPEPCRVNLSVVPAAFPVGGGQGLLRIETGRECEWRADDAAAEGVTLGAAAGIGPAQVPIAVAANTLTSDRRATIRVGAASAELLQTGQQSCTYRVDPVRSLFGMDGGTGTIFISTAPGCAWTVRTQQAFFPVLRDAGSGSGSRAVTFDVPRKRGGRHLDTGAIEFRWAAPSAGENVWIGQTGDCEIQFPRPVEQSGSAYLLSFAAAGGTQRIQVFTEPPAICEWRIQDSPAWLTAAYFGRSGPPPFSDLLRLGSAPLELTAAPNPSSAPRTVIIRVGETPLTVTQAGR